MSTTNGTKPPTDGTNGSGRWGVRADAADRRRQRFDNWVDAQMRNPTPGSTFDPNYIWPSDVAPSGSDPPDES